MTYETLQTRIANELATPEVSSRIKQEILSSIQFYQNERLWFLECESTASTVASQANYAVPDDLLTTDALTLTSDSVRRPLNQVTWEQYRTLADTTTPNRPKHFAYYVDEYWLYPVPDQVYTLTVSYLADLSDLSAGTDTNAWLTEGEELIRLRTKYSLMLDRDPQRALGYRLAADETLDNLKDRSHRKIRDRSMSVDSALVSRGAFNINTG